MITFNFEDRILTGDKLNRVIPVLDKKGKPHLAKWGEFYRTEFTVGLYHDLTKVRDKPGAILVPCPILRYTGTTASSGVFTKHYHEPACGLIERHHGIGSRVYLVVGRDAELGQIAPMRYREVMEMLAERSSGERAEE